MAISKSFRPWRDRAGRVSPLKTATLIAAVLPAAWLALEAARGWLLPQPFTEALHQSGLWAVRFLLLSLAVTPFRRIWQWGGLIAVRRMLGLTALAYAVLHLALYVAQQHGDLPHVAGEIASRPYLTLGFAALLGLLVLGATSTDGMIRSIGGRRWQSLHRSVYAIGLLCLVHFALQAKLDVSQPMLAAGLFLQLMGWRLLARRKRGDDAAALLGLAVASSLCTALAEAGWYALVHHIDAAQVLAADLSLDDGPSAAAVVLAVGLAVAASRWARVALPHARDRLAAAARRGRRLPSFGD